VAFSLIAVAYYPALTLVLTVFSLLVAASRVVLGLHYPSDVVAGAALGGAIALGSFTLLV
jgi:undecaprenyl-diphosphatase